MAERPDIEAWGTVESVLEADRLYKIAMANGHQAYGVIERKGPRAPSTIEQAGARVRVAYSPYDMSKCLIVAWDIPCESGDGDESLGELEP